jgi:alkyl sulfatase BDS1-like metallo-beta-lactamase superfamily hydrolase
MGRKTSFALGVLLGVVLTGVAAVALVSAFRNLIAVALPPDVPELPRDAAAPVSATTAAARAKLVAELDFTDSQDFDFGARGFVATREDPLILQADGSLAFDLRSYDFLQADAPETVNPSLWRQARLVTRHGLFQLAERIYQVRGFDVSSVTFILGERGYIVVDPLTSSDVARAAFELVKKHVGERPIVAVVYSHSHVDHFGGVVGLVSEDDVAAGRVAIIAPAGFMEHAVAENIIAGNAMGRRARFQFGLTLPRGADGELTSGLGPGISRGPITLIAPTVSIAATGQELTLDGVRLVFQLTPATEAPAEMNFFLPEMRALFMAENANATLHNLLPARGALVRDAKGWADYLTEAIRRFAPQSDVMFAAHGIPRFGTQEIADHLNKHRDAYKYLHDQSVRLMNAGLTGPEIAEVLELPAVLAREWYNRGYYGTLSHNSKAVYQRYMGWYDANPASLNALPREAAARHYVDAIGGADAALEKAQAAITAGDLRWAAMLLDHVVFADAGNERAKQMLADVYTQLGYGAEAGTWRNIYLTGAQELRHGVTPYPAPTASPSLLRATPTGMLLDLAAVRLNPERAAGKSLRIQIVLNDRKERHLVRVQNGVLIHEPDVEEADVQATVKLAREDLLMTLLAGVPVAVRTASGAIQIEGDAGAYAELVGLIEPADPNFAIVTP